MKRQEAVRGLVLSLHGKEIAYLTGYQGGKNIISFTPEFAYQQTRSTLSLAQLHDAKLFENPWITQQRLHPILSNLLPEGNFRTYLAEILKIHPENEFALLAWLGQDLPGALIATPVEQIPNWALASRDSIEPVILSSIKQGQHFSLAGIQIKFSTVFKNGRYQVSHAGELGDWIVKPPSLIHSGVPLNEYSIMKLASLAGVEIPEIRLVPMNKLFGLPDIQIPKEEFAYAIKRFDREHDHRIHSEDFAQITLRYAHEKYQYGNYELIGRILYQYAADGLGAVQQFARRLLINILLANGDAHLKNWSVIYPDRVRPVLAPAYDIVYTQAYITGETSTALNMAEEKNWYKFNMTHFKRWADKIGVAWPNIEVHLRDTIERAREFWPSALADLPMLEPHQAALKKHWQKLSTDWRITVK